MSIDVLEYRYLQENDQAITVLLPVWAYECESHPKLRNELDAYEHATLQLIRLGLGQNGIASALNTSPSLIGNVMSNLANENFVERTRNKGWTITNDAQAYFDGKLQDRMSKESEYGWMFVSALRKDVLPYFHKGAIEQVKLSRDNSNHNRLTLAGSNTDFPDVHPHNKAFSRSYYNFSRINDHLSKPSTYQMSETEKAQISEFLFSDLEMFDDEPDMEEQENGTTQVPNGSSKDDAPDSAPKYVRKLMKPGRKFYLPIRILFGSHYINGYTVESPFELEGFDNSWFLRQIQWMISNPEIMLGETSLQQFIENETTHMARKSPIGEKDYSVFLLQNYQLLNRHKEDFLPVYDDLKDIYQHMQTAETQIDREGVVNSLCTKMLEPLYERLFISLSERDLGIVARNARQDYLSNRAALITRLSVCCKLKTGTLSEKVLDNSIQHMTYSHGNSILEKINNLILIYYYSPTERIRKFIELDDFQRCIDTVKRLNQIRNSVDHKTQFIFTPAEYYEFTQVVFPVASRMTEAIVGGK